MVACLPPHNTYKTFRSSSSPPLDNHKNIFWSIVKVKVCNIKRLSDDFIFSMFHPSTFKKTYAPFQWWFFNMCYLTRIFAFQKCNGIKQISLQKESCLLMLDIQIMIHGLEKCHSNYITNMSAIFLLSKMPIYTHIVTKKQFNSADKTLR